MVGHDFVSLCSIPAVLCSNNWQSAVNQPSACNHVANDFTRLNQVTPVSKVVHQIPEFDQDSWTIDNPPPRTEKTTTDFPGNTQPPDQTNNNNNNNNTFFTDDRATGQCSAANRAYTSNCDSHPTGRISTLSRTADRAAAATTNGASSLTMTATPPSELSGTSSQSQTADAVAGETITTDDMAVETLTTNGVAAEPQPTNETRELPVINGEDVQE